MPTSRHTSLSLRTQLNGLSSALLSYSKDDAFASMRLAQQLAVVRGQIEREQVDDLLPLCTLALRLAEFLNKEGQIGPQQAVEVIDGVVTQICTALGVEREVPAPKVDTPAQIQPLSAPEVAAEQGKPTKPAGPSASPAKRAAAPGLKLVSHRKLGELMMQMSLLTPQQVEQALSHQRMTGCRFGEALVQMRIVPRETIEGVLRIQNARRSPAGDNWGSAR